MVVKEKPRRKKKWGTSYNTFTGIAHHIHIKGSWKRPVFFKNSTVRFKILALTSKFCSSEPNSTKNVTVESFIFLNSKLILKLLLRKLDWTSIVCTGVSTPPQKHHPSLSFQPPPLKSAKWKLCKPPLFRQSPLYIGFLWTCPP